VNFGLGERVAAAELGVEAPALPGDVAQRVADLIEQRAAGLAEDVLDGDAGVLDSPVSVSISGSSGIVGSSTVGSVVCVAGSSISLVAGPCGV